MELKFVCKLALELTPVSACNLVGYFVKKKCGGNSSLGIHVWKNFFILFANIFYVGCHLLIFLTGLLPIKPKLLFLPSSLSTK